jgi:hypothetical protein
MKPSGIEPATFRLEAQCLDTACPDDEETMLMMSLAKLDKGTVN